MSENFKIQKYENTIVNLKFGVTQNHYFFTFALNKYKYFLCSTHIYAISSFVLITFTSLQCILQSVSNILYSIRYTRVELPSIGKKYKQTRERGNIFIEIKYVI